MNHISFGPIVYYHEVSTLCQYFSPDKRAMRSRGVVLIVLLVITIVKSAQVTFPFSDVFQLSSDLVFNCAEQCAVFVSRRTEDMEIWSNNEVVANFNDIVNENLLESGGVLLKAGRYESRTEKRYRYTHPHSSYERIILYVLSASAPNFDTTPVFALQDKNDMIINTQHRYFTILSESRAMNFNSFRGTFPPGYPRIYAAGFDAIGDIYGVTSCRPMYQARSQTNAEHSSPTIIAPIATVDFGYYGDHSVVVKQVDGRDSPLKSSVSSVVYMTPGYVGCPFVGNQGYDYTTHNGYDREITDSFTILAKSLDISIAYYEVSRVVKFRVNQDIIDFSSNGLKFFRKHYYQGAFKVELQCKWPTNGRWALQLDFGTDKDTSTPESSPETESTTESWWTVSRAEFFMVIFVLIVFWMFNL